MRKLISLTVACASIAFGSNLFCASADAQWGTLKGQIVLDGDVPEIPPLVAKSDPNVKCAAVCAAAAVPDEKLVVDPTNKGIANVFVFLAKKPDKIHPSLQKSKEAELTFDQKGCRFTPHAMVVRTDQRVRVLSDDPVPHNTRTNPIKNDGDNFTVIPSDRIGSLTKPLKVAEKTPTKINCDIHPWMVSYWLIIDHPYAAVTDAQGNFEIPNLPVGEHEFSVWQESAGWLNRKYVVTIKAGENKPAPLKFGLDKIFKDEKK